MPISADLSLTIAAALKIGRNAQALSADLARHAATLRRQSREGAVVDPSRLGALARLETTLNDVGRGIIDAPLAMSPPARTAIAFACA